MCSKRTSNWFYIVITLVLLSYSESHRAAGFGIKFVREPLDRVVRLGSTWGLDCSVGEADDKPHQVVWFKDDLPLEFASNQRLLLNGTLLTKGFEESNTGKYVCLAKSGTIGRMSRTAVVAVAAIQADPIDKVLDVSEEENALLPCNVRGNPEPKALWTKDGRQIHPGARMFQLSSNRLHIVGISAEDAGFYVCSASNVAGKLGVSALRVNVSPRNDSRRVGCLVDATQEVEVVEGEPAVLECLWSVADSVWFKDNIRLDQLAKVGSSLSIANASVQDAGLYVCRSSLDFKFESRVVLEVLVPPTLLSPSEQEVLVNNSRAFNLTCVFGGRPRPGVRWYKDGEVVRESAMFRTIGPEFAEASGGWVYRSTVSVRYPSPASAGAFQCRVFNKMGEVGATFFVSAVQSFATATLLSPPRNLKAVPLSKDEMQLSWDPPDGWGDTVTMYSIHLWCDFEEKREETERTSATITAMRPFTTYTFHVRAQRGFKSSGPSESVTERTMEDVPLSVPEVTLKVVNSSSIFVQWGKLNEFQARGIIVRHRVELMFNEGRAVKPYEYEGSTYNMTFLGLKPKQRYDIRVFSRTGVGYPDPREFNAESLWQVIYLNKDENDPVFYPKKVRVDVRNATHAMVSWKVTQKSRAIEFYGYTLRITSFRLKLLEYLTNPSHTSYNISGLNPGTTYTLEIYASTNAVNGKLSAFSTFKTLLPNDVTAGASNGTSISFSINPGLYVGDLETGTGRVCYDVYSTLEEFLCREWKAIEEQTIGEFVIADLKPLTNYRFGIQDGQGWIVLRGVSSTGVPPPRDVQFVEVEGRGLNISWKFPFAVANLFFKVFYTDDANLPLSNWSSRSVEGSETFHFIENLAGRRELYVKVSSVVSGGLNASSDVLLVRAARGGEEQDQLVTRHPASIVTFVFVAVAALVASVVVVALCARRKLLRVHKKDCFDKDAVCLAPIKPFQSNNASQGATACNGGRRGNDEPLLNKRTPPAGQSGVEIVSPPREDRLRALEPNESSV